MKFERENQTQRIKESNQRMKLNLGLCWNLGHIQEVILSNTCQNGETE